VPPGRSTPVIDGRTPFNPLKENPMYIGLGTLLLIIILIIIFA
jgi:hypothetical protein